jgi:hypothetical protein
MACRLRRCHECNFPVGNRDLFCPRCGAKQRREKLARAPFAAAQGSARLKFPRQPVGTVAPAARNAQNTRATFTAPPLSSARVSRTN